MYLKKKRNKNDHVKTSIYCKDNIYIYISIYVCMCVFLCAKRKHIYIQCTFVSGCTAPLLLNPFVLGEEEQGSVQV